MNKLYYLLFVMMFFGVSSAQIINFPDPNFKAKLLQPNVASNSQYQSILIDANSDGEIEVSEAQQVVGLNVLGGNISDLTGISFFTNLKILNCDYNLLTSITIDDSIELWSLTATHNALTTVNVNFDPITQYAVNLSYNNLTSYTLQSAQYYELIDLSHNQLTELIINDCAIDAFDVSYNNLTSIQNNGVVLFDNYSNFRNNQFSFLDLSNFSFGYDASIYLGNNILDNVHFVSQPGNIYYSSLNTSFDTGNYMRFTTCDPELTGNLILENCPNLTQLTLKNGYNHTTITCNEGGDIFQNPALHLQITNCPNLSFICVDEPEMSHIQARINQIGLANQVQVNTYCSFTPEGTFYTISGSANFNVNGNGCEGSEVAIPNILLNVAGGSNNGVAMSNSLGNYTIPVLEGTHSLTPVLENAAYFSVSPSSVNVTFPGSSSTFTQNFCISPVGTHHDISVTAMPIGAAVPGFDANYGVTINNIGNQVANGTVTFTYDETVVDFVSATGGPVNVTSGQILINFSNLLPFENRFYLHTLNLNSPMETPPLDQGNVLEFTIIADTGVADETPANNTQTFTQTVVNSMDPNQITCVEGASIPASMVGEYVHYIIEFENLGTFPATNVVVKDMIDTSKFVVNTLVPLASSHPFETRITQTNKVEFIFENINLPFDDANNDGYIAFKIKTKPTLTAGDSFSNSASIYFDYNFPIVTNTATTTITSLATANFTTDKFTIYPNPAKSEIRIYSVNEVEVQTINIYNLLGQLVLTVPPGQSPEIINVSQLNTGNYFVKIQSENGTSTERFIKQ